MKNPAELKKELSRLASGQALVGGGTGLVLALVTVIACGRFYVYSFLYKPKHSPPALVFYLFFVFLCGLAGYAAGYALSGCKKEKRRWGAVLFCGLALLFLILWYISFFAALSCFFALFLLLCALLLMVFAVRELFLFGVPGAVPAALCGVGIVLLLWFNAAVILLN